ncbi:MAG: N-Acetyl-D-glucosamine ABC transport system, permease protein 1, partial [uncultured Thermomicrobiales bacterium]
ECRSRWFQKCRSGSVPPTQLASRRGSAAGSDRCVHAAESRDHPLPDLHRRAAGRCHRAQLLRMEPAHRCRVRGTGKLPEARHRRRGAGGGPQHLRLRLLVAGDPRRPRVAAGAGDPAVDPWRAQIPLPHRDLLSGDHVVGSRFPYLALHSRSQFRLHQLLPRPARAADQKLVADAGLGDARDHPGRPLEDDRVYLHPDPRRVAGCSATLARGGQARRCGIGPPVLGHHPADALADPVHGRNPDLHRRVPDLRADVHHDRGRTARQNGQHRDADLRDRIPPLRDGLRLGDGDRGLPGDPGRNPDPDAPEPVLGVLRV